MQYTVNFDRATAVFDLAAKSPLMLYESGQSPRAIELESAMGYDLEIAYFIDCIAAGQPPRTVTMKDATNCIRILEAERQSVLSGKPVTIA